MSATRRFLLGPLCLLLGVSDGVRGQGVSDEFARDAAAALRAASGGGGLIVHVACGSGELTGALARQSSGVLHGLAGTPADLTAARAHLTSLGLYGRASADLWDGVHLPYADGLVTTIIAETANARLRVEAMRALAPLGCLLVREGNAWRPTAKAWPGDIDEWTHYLHNARNNAVAEDTRIGPPRSLKWIGDPLWARHHDRLASMSAMVSAGNRLFTIFDEGPTSSILLPSRWMLIARDAFNGVVLWKKAIPDWQTRFWPLKSGPAQLPRRLVATRNAVYATLGINVPLTALNAADGSLKRTYAGSKGTVEILHDDGVLFLLVDPDLNTEKYTSTKWVNKPWWSREQTKIMAYRAEDGALLWEHASPVVPLTLGVGETAVYFHDGSRVAALNRNTGAPKWQSDPVPIVHRVMSFFAPTLVVADGVILFAGGEESGLVKSTGGATKSDTLTALDAGDGSVLWQEPHPPSGYSSPEDLFVIDNTVWFEESSNGRLPGRVTGRDLRTGRIKKDYAKADVDTYWFHHRCYRGKATTRYLMTSRTGIEFIDPLTGHWDINHWTRGGCLYGIMPANGLIYTPPHDCACYEESKFFGFSALAAKSTPDPDSRVTNVRLEKGPAYAWAQTTVQPASPPGEWPTYRQNAERTGALEDPVGTDLTERWKTDLGGRLTAVTIGDGRVYVAAPDRHTVHALDAASGDILWSHVAGGRVDSPPTIHAGTVIFGSRDGCITCLRAADGERVWRYRAAPADIRIMAFGHVESRWPVHGSVLILGETVYAVAGRMLFLDGGMRFLRLNARTGECLSETVLDARDPETGEGIQKHVKRLTMPVALPDILSGDGDHIYMRSQVFTMAGRRVDIAPHDAALGKHAAVQEGPTQHLFASNGFLDGSWFHRAYWLYGRSFEGGWNSYYLAGRRAPAGKLLCVDKTHVYGFGREPKYFRWTVPMEFQLFAVPREQRGGGEAPAAQETGSIVRVDKSGSLDPTGVPVVVTAWIRPDRPTGVVLAHGGAVLGYSLFLRGGNVCFAVTDKSKRGEAVSGKPCPSGWVHVAGALTLEGEIRVYINGALAGTARAPALISKNPANPLQIGADEESQVGNYSNGCPFKGDIDDVRIYHGPVAEELLRQMAENPESAVPEGMKCVLHFSFDNGKARDLSAHKNNGRIVGAKIVPGKRKKAMRFNGVLPGAPSPVSIHYTWTRDAPVLARGMVLAGDTLFVAGPEDLLDEPKAMKQIGEDATLRLLQQQNRAVAGEAGGLMLAIARRDGKTLAKLRLDAIPVWDGLAAAKSALYFACVDGAVRCLAPRPR